MPKVSVYLPDELYRKVRERGLALSALTQRAVEDELRRTGLADWLANARSVPPRVRDDVDTAAVMDDVRDEFGR